MRYVFIFMIMAFAVACNAPKEEKLTSAPSPSADSNEPVPQQDTAKLITTQGGITIDNVFDSLRAIPFVKKSNDYIDSFSQHKHGIAFLVDTTSPTELFIKAGYNGNAFHFDTYYMFKVNPLNFDIKVVEPVSGDDLTPEEYIKRKQDF